jgi:hypothetical protein
MHTLAHKEFEGPIHYGCMGINSVLKYVVVSICSACKHLFCHWLAYSACKHLFCPLAHLFCLQAPILPGSPYCLQAPILPTDSPILLASTYSAHWLAYSACKHLFCPLTHLFCLQAPILPTDSPILLASTYSAH